MITFDDAPNLNALWARLTMAEFVRSGARHVVVCPGSRSTPLALAAHASGLDLVVALDERGAAFHALGIAKATNGKVIAHLVKANKPPTEGTGWHHHVCEFQIVLMTKGWAKFMYEDKVTLVEAGDCIHQRSGMTHYLFDYSPDMEYLEIVSPADFGTVEVEGPCEIPPSTPWQEK